MFARPFSAALVVAFLALPGTANAAPLTATPPDSVVLDTFDSVGSIRAVLATAGNPTRTFGPDPLSNSTFGSYARSGSLELTAFSGGGNPSTKLNINGGSGRLAYQSDNNTDGRYTLVYSGSPLIGLTTSVVFDFQNSGNAGDTIDFTVALLDSNGKTLTGTGSVQGANSQTVLTVNLNTSDGYNPDLFTSLTITADASPETNFTLNSIDAVGGFGGSGSGPGPTVPEPATVAAFGALLGLGALGARLRRKRPA